MKKFFIILFSIVMLLAAGVTVFTLTFDANRYKDILIARLEESMNRDVRIDNISLSLLHGFGLELMGVAIKDRNKTWEDFLLKANRLNASIKIPPLLKKDIQIQRLFIHGLEINAGDGANGPVFRCGLVLNARILLNSLSQDDMLKTLTAKGNMKLTDAV